MAKTRRIGWRSLLDPLHGLGVQESGRLGRRADVPAATDSGVARHRGERP